MRHCIIIVFFVLMSILLWCIYYFIPRHVNFELVQTFAQPITYFDRTKETNFNYIHSKDDLWWWLGEWYSTKPYFKEKNIIGYQNRRIRNACRRSHCGNGQPYHGHVKSQIPQNDE